MSQKTYAVHGMDCADCARTIENGVRQLPGVQSAEVNFAAAKLRVSGNTPEAVIRQRVEALGYQLATPTPPSTHTPPVLGFWRYLLARTETRLALIGAALLLAAWPISNSLISNSLLLLSLLLSGYPIARSGLNALLINRDFNINLLMTIAAVGAALIGELREAASVILLFAIAEALEGFTVDQARDSLRGLMELAPAAAIRLKEGREENVPVEALRVGDMILVRPGERIPMDGLISAGASDVNQAPITGESLPVHKDAGAEVFAGTLNGEGALEVRVTRLAQDNTLSRIIHLVEESQSARAPSQRLIDQFARYYTPGVVALALLAASVPPLLFNQPFFDTPVERGWLYRALALLVIACPCALVISAPVTIISALTAGARRGVLIKGGAHLEALSRIQAFAFDKTGTLTRGEPVVTIARSVDCVTGGECEHCDDVLALAAALERRSAHPLARAVVAAAEQRGLAETYPPAADVETLTGRGLAGRVNGKWATLGNHALFDSEHPHADEVCAWIDAAEARGQTTMVLCDGDRVRGFLALADAVHPDSRAAIAELQSLGARAIMLTGDNPQVAAEIGAQVGVSDIRANLLPEDKSDAVKALRAEHGNVAMVGDGINDTPALAAATVGIAVGAATGRGGAASAQALETADIVLMADGLRQLPFAVRLARLARTLLIQGIAISLLTKLVFVALDLAGYASLWLAIAADMGVSLLVTLNGMRALTFETSRRKPLHRPQGQV
jgi:Cd2+/Zn2+-exporting ATPase